MWNQGEWQLWFALHLTRVCQLGHNYQSWVKTHTMSFAKSKLKQPKIVFLTNRPFLGKLFKKINSFGGRAGGGGGHSPLFLSSHANKYFMEKFSTSLNKRKTRAQTPIFSYLRQSLDIFHIFIILFFWFKRCTSRHGSFYSCSKVF